MNDNKFPEGMRLYKPRETAPSFVKGDLVVSREFIEYFNNNNKQGQLRLQLKESKAGGLYLELNTWEKPTTIPEIKKDIYDMLGSRTETPSNASNLSSDESNALKQARQAHNVAKPVTSEDDFGDFGINTDEIPFN
jgi:hypothetical protein